MTANMAGVLGLLAAVLVGMYLGHESHPYELCSSTYADPLEIDECIHLWKGTYDQ